MSRMPRNPTDPDAEARRLQEHLDVIVVELEHRKPGLFQINYGRTFPRGPEGLVVRALGVKGHAFVEAELPAVARGARRADSAGDDGAAGGAADIRYGLSLWTDDGRESAEPDPGDDHLLDVEWSADPGVIVRRLTEWHTPPRPNPVGPVDDDGERRRLTAIAAGRRGRYAAEQGRRSVGFRVEGRVSEACRAVGLHPGFEPSKPVAGLTPAGRDALADDLKHMAADRLVWHFPSQDDGRWPLGAYVLLAAYPTAKSVGRGREMWLAAVSPARRGDEQVLRLVLEPLIGENHPHRWDLARWLWDDRHAGADEDKRLGAPGLTIRQVGPAGRAKHLARLTRVCGDGGGTDAQRAALSLLLLDAGEVEAALAACGVGLSDAARKVLGGNKLYGQCCADQARWAETMERAVRRCAPWRLKAAFLAEAAREAACVRRPRPRPWFKLAVLPGQRHARKASVVLAADDRDGRNLRLDIEATAGNRVLPHVLWQRPIELDFRRFGVEAGLFPVS